ncbi:hypothetical protein R6Q59_024646 [Mikania micrantha]
MDPETVINLFDSYWFNHEILKNDPNDSWVKTHKSEIKYSSLRSILVRSQSEDIGSRSFNYGSFSPNSVLKSIPSGKQDFTTRKQEQEQEQVQEPVEQVQEPETTMEDQIIKKKKNRRRHGISKSLSDLEFEELKGFMDMGFVFSKQDKDSSLVEIIPGLQRLGEEIEREDDDGDDDGDGDGDDDDGDERRPYLSEAWDDWDRKWKKKEHKEPVPPVMNWKIPAVGDEIDMKDNLKLWAHTVASLAR